MKYSAGETVRLNNGTVVVILYVLTEPHPRYRAGILQGEPPLSAAGGVTDYSILPRDIRGRVKAVYTDEPEPKPITALDARLLVGRAAVEFGLEVNAVRIAPERYELSFLGDLDGDRCPHTRYFKDVDEAGRFLNSL